jgi:sulfopyruvate decarboxylase alpha subunit
MFRATSSKTEIKNKRVVTMTETATDWPAEIFDVLRRQGIDLIVHVPDAGHARLIEMCEADNTIDTITCTSEEEGIHMLCGAWLGGQKGAMLIQSSGVGNIINALAMPSTCRIPILAIVTMRGEYGEFNPWQVPMGQGTPGCLEAMGMRLHRTKTWRVSHSILSSFAAYCCRKNYSARRILGSWPNEQ